MTDTHDDTVPDARAELGVLFVHGIGVQDEGETLLAAASSLLDELASDGGHVEYGRTLLKPSRELERGPAHLMATVSNAGPDPAPTRLVLAESWWARVFDAPSYGALLGWLMSYGTWIAIRHLAFRIATPVRAIERRYQRKGRHPPDWLGVAELALAFPGGFLSVFLVAIPLQIVLLAIGVLALLPFKLTQDAAGRFALGISAILGDASVYTANPAVRHAILTRVRDDLAWIRARSKRVVVLAHSQGAAVAFDLLRSLADLKDIHLVTYGAGIRKLTELERDARARPLLVGLCSALWLLGIAAVVAAWHAGAYVVDSFAHPGATALGDRAGSLLMFGLFLLPVALTLFYWRAREADTETDQQLLADAQALLAKGLTWADLYASSDPVPGGPLLGDHALAPEPSGWLAGREELQGFRSRAVVNRLSTIADHTSYWNVPNDFVSAVAGQIRSWANWSSAPWSVDLGRHGRMRWRRAVGVLLGVGAIAVFWRAGSPLRDSVLVPAWDLLKIDPASTTGQIVAHFGLQPLAIGAAGLAINLALVLAYGRFVLDPCWNAWERSRQRRRPDAFEGAQSFPQFVARWLHRTGGCARAGVCALVATVPLLILAQIVRHGGFMPAVGSLLQIGEFIRGAFAWLLMGATLLGVVGFVWQGWEALQAWRQRRRAGE